MPCKLAEHTEQPDLYSFKRLSPPLSSEPIVIDDVPGKREILEGAAQVLTATWRILL
jgi:hypothetical protein